MLIESGELRVRGVLDDEPEVTLVVPAGVLGLQVVESLVEEHLMFHVQIWFVPSRGV